jgi:hypothetical protein
LLILRGSWWLDRLIERYVAIALEVYFMKAITLRMSDEFHKKLKMKMVEEEKTMQDHIIKLLSEDFKNSKKTK